MGSELELPDWERLLAAERHLQHLFPGAVLVGGTAAAHAGHRVSMDGDHVLEDLLQHDRFNRTHLNTAIVAAITSNLKYSGLPGNVGLPKGEGGLPRASVFNVTQIATVDRSDIDSVAGRLSRQRLAEVWDGIRLVIEPTGVEAAAVSGLLTRPIPEPKWRL